MSVLAAARRPAPDADAASASAWRSNGALAWMAATVSLVLATNLWLTRYLWPDALFDVYAGRYIAAHGLPSRNVFTFASHGAPWVDQQWLAHLIYFACYSAGGYAALVALSSVLVAGGFAVLALMMLRRGVAPARMFAWTIAAFVVSLGNTEVRAQSFGYLFLALTLWLVVEDSSAAQMKRRTWLVMPVLAVWANTYGSVLLGAGAVALYAAYRLVKALGRRDGRGARAYAALGILAGTAPLITPYGLAVVGYYRQFLVSPVVARYDPQWGSPRLSSPVTWAFFAMVVATGVAITVAWRRGTRPDVVLTALAVVLLVGALRTYKDIAWYGYAGSLLAADAGTMARGSRPDALGSWFRRAVAAALSALVVQAALVLATTPDRVFLSWLPWRASNAAARAAGDVPGVRVLADSQTGSTLLGLQPALLGRVGFDVRLEQYTAAQLSALADFLHVTGPRWQRAMSGYDVVVVDRYLYPKVAAKIAKLRGWRVVYADPYGIVIRRETTGTGDGRDQRKNRLSRSAGSSTRT